MAEKREEMTDELYDRLVSHMKPVRRHLGDLDATNLTRQRGKLYARQRQVEGFETGGPKNRRRKPVSDGTILREVVNLRAALNWAKREKWIDEVPYVPAPSAPPPKDRWLTREEFAKLLDGARSPHIKLFIVLALCTAARAGALLELPWSAVDLEGRRINLGRGKGNKGRAIVPINDTLLAVLIEANEGRVQPEDGSPPTVIQEHGKAVKSIKTGFRGAVARAGLAGVTPHVLRHTAATWMAMDGIDMLPISRFLGHRNTKVTEAVYASHSPEFLADAARSLGLGRQNVATVNENLSIQATQSKRKA
jgi:integrase